MKYNELNAPKNKNRIRAARGIAAGRGKTAGRGTKGQSARSGGKRAPGFEGGQTPLLQRIPKVRGFNSLHSETATVTTTQLNDLSTKDAIDINFLIKNKVVRSKNTNFKIVKGKTPLEKKIKVIAKGISAGAAVEFDKVGATFEQASVRLPQEKHTKKKEK